MVKLIRNNQKTVLAGITILSTLIFVLAPSNRSGGIGGPAEVKIGTINGKPVYNTEFVEARAEMSALIHSLTFTGEERDPKIQLMHGLISVMGNKPELFPLLRHEAIADGVQVSNDDVEGVLANYTRDLDPDSDVYFATRAGVTDLLKIISRYEQVAAAVKISKPLADLELVEEFESLQMDLIQLQASDFIAKVPPPTTQQLQSQFTQFADQPPHHPTPTNNPLGFGYRLPVRAKLQYIYLSPDAVNAVVVATKSPYDWEVQARKYYLAHANEFPATKPVMLPSTQPAGPQPFQAVRDRILSDIRQPLVTALADQVQSFLSTTLNTDWQLYSQATAAANPGPEPASSLGVPYTSYDYLIKLIEKVQSKFKVVLTVNQTPAEISQDQIAALAPIGTPTIADAAISQATDYLTLVDKKSPAAAAQLMRPSLPLQGAVGNSTVFLRLSGALASQPAPGVASVQAQVAADAITAAAYQLALDQAKALVANAQNLPLPIVHAAKNQFIHVDRLNMGTRDIPEIKPALGDSAPSFIRQAFQLLGPFDPIHNHNPAETIELPEQARVFAAQLSFVDASWNNENYFFRTMSVRDSARQMQRQPLLQQWFSVDSITQRLAYKPTAKNNGT